MDNPPVQGPAITVTNGWANPGGTQDRTTVGIGELNSFVVSDVAGGSWKSADGKGTDREQRDVPVDRQRRREKTRSPTPPPTSRPPVSP